MRVLKRLLLLPILTVALLGASLLVASPATAASATAPPVTAPPSTAPPVTVPPGTTTPTAGPLAAMTVTPSRPLVPISGTVTFTLSGTDATGRPVSIPAGATMVVDSNSETLIAPVSFSALGVHQIMFYSGHISAYAEVTVYYYELTYMIASPGDYDVIAGATIAPDIYVVDRLSRGYLVSNSPTDVSYSVDGSSVRIPGAAVTIAQVGSHVVTFYYGNLSVRTPVIVRSGPTAKLTVVPLTTTVIAGDPVSFSVQGADAANNATALSLNNVMLIDSINQVAFSPLSATVGTAVFSTAGIHSLVFFYGSVMAVVKITVTAAKLATITATPSAKTVAINSTASFSLAGADKFGNAVDVPAGTTIADDKKPAISGTTVTLTTQGTHTVVISNSGISTTQQIVVVAPAPAQSLPAPPATTKAIIASVPPGKIAADTAKTKVTTSGTSTTQPLAALTPTAPLVVTYKGWTDSSDVFVDVYAYSTPVWLGSFMVIDGEITTDGLDLSALAAGDHHLVMIGQTSHELAVIPITIAPVVGSGAQAIFAHLGTAGSFSVLAGAAITAPGSSIDGDFGAAAAITLDAGSSTSGRIRSVSDTATALADLKDGYAALSTLEAVSLTSANLGGATLTAGVYHSAAALTVTGDLTFDAEGDPNAVFIIQTDAALNTTAGTTMLLLNGAKASNIYWVSAAATTLGAGSSFSGTIVSQAAITVGAGSTVHGRALSLFAAVTLDANVISSNED